MASGKRQPVSAKDLADELAGQITAQALKHAADKISSKAQRQAEKIAAKADRAARHAERLERFTDLYGYDAIDMWTRAEPGRRRSRFSRHDIAEAALRIADAEGLEAVSMRRLAQELGAGTMTLYHYVRTKDELFALITDAVMGEVLVPKRTPLPEDWRAAMTLIATRTRNALRKHSWILDVVDDPPVSPNNVKHFDQSLQAVASLPGGFDDKLDVIATVDEFVFGFCMHERRHAHDSDNKADDEELVEYVEGLVASGGYPALAALIAEHGSTAVWNLVTEHADDSRRFERNLARLLDGIARSLEDR